MISLCNNVHNILWEHQNKFEMNLMNIEYPIFFKKINKLLLLFNGLLKGLEMIWKSNIYGKFLIYMYP